MPLWTKKIIMGTSALAVLVVGAAAMVHGLAPVEGAGTPSPAIFTIQPGDGFRTVMANLQADGLIRSAATADIFSLLDGSALRLKAGSYELNPGMSAVQILHAFTGAGSSEVSVTIPEGKNIFEIDGILAKAGVIKPGALVHFTADGNLEGRLFPDTYRFFIGSPVPEVVQKFLDNFQLKAAPLLAADPRNATSDLVMASLVEKEVPDPADQKIVAGILWKRKSNGVPLQVDATLCYAMWVQAYAATTGADAAPGAPDCSTLDTKINSVYNTYLNKGFPPAPIGNPGISAIQAAISPTPSPYWYYLSDPKTGKTIFAKTLDEQHQNTVKYLIND